MCTEQYGEGGLLSFYKATVPVTVTFFVCFFSFVVVTSHINALQHCIFTRVFA